MQKLCTQCETLFTPKENQRGSEQIYCSIKCRSNAAQQRMINKIKENAIKETRQPIVAENNNNISGNRIDTQQRADNFSPDIIRLMELNFETRNKISELELKNLYLTKEIEELKQEIINLELELQEAESPGEENEGMLGGIMKQFKEDPVTTISFASELINNLLKPKINAA
jgi:superfamily II DNA helicase RecQ